MNHLHTTLTGFLTVSWSIIFKDFYQIARLNLNFSQFFINNFKRILLNSGLWFQLHLPWLRSAMVMSEHLFEFITASQRRNHRQDFSNFSGMKSMYVGAKVRCFFVNTRVATGGKAAKACSLAGFWEIENGAAAQRWSGRQYGVLVCQKSTVAALDTTLFTHFILACDWKVLKEATVGWRQPTVASLEVLSFWIIVILNVSFFNCFINDLFHFLYNYSFTDEGSSGTKMKMKIISEWSHCVCCCYENGNIKRLGVNQRLVIRDCRYVSFEILVIPSGKTATPKVEKNWLPEAAIFVSRPMKVPWLICLWHHLHCTVEWKSF